MAEKKLIDLINSPLAVRQAKIFNYQINYVSTGSGPPLLLIHGANIGWGQWYLNIDELSKHFSVFAIDLPGAGESDNPDFRKADLDRDYLMIVDCFIQSLGFDKISIVGHSFGALIALRLVMQKKPYIGKMVLVSPMGFSDHIPLRQKPLVIYSLAWLLSKTVMRITKKNMAKFISEAVQNKAGIQEEFTDYYFERVKRKAENHPFFFIHMLIKFLRANLKLFIVGLKDIRVPILIIFGDKDRMVPLSKSLKFFKQVPNVQIEVVKNIGHVFPIEAPSMFNKMVIDFLIS